ncbi:hypothetical protein AU378_02930 [Chryseobacterium kwangjuense]|uniref:Uncharacterized protein n=1 Tax=Chryseobacterium kwangjuense TaxID=267125 RepID=A0A135WIN0_9FLAO|nr:hypothetical protein AU378_02930 [Chryseobacterium kwangjuense]
MIICFLEIIDKSGGLKMEASSLWVRCFFKGFLKIAFIFHAKFDPHNSYDKDAKRQSISLI